MKGLCVEKIHDRLTVTVESCKAGLCTLAALIAAKLLASASPSGAFDPHSSIVMVDLM